MLRESRATDEGFEGIALGSPLASLSFPLALLVLVRDNRAVVDRRLLGGACKPEALPAQDTALTTQGLHWASRSWTWLRIWKVDVPA